MPAASVTYRRGWQRGSSRTSTALVRHDFVFAIPGAYELRFAHGFRLRSRFFKLFPMVIISRPKEFKIFDLLFNAIFDLVYLEIGASFRDFAYTHSLHFRVMILDMKSFRSSSATPSLNPSSRPQDHPYPSMHGSCHNLTPKAQPIEPSLGPGYG
ncbi:hypothetical protein E3N88_36664 [Mikania micrantha]|uniref:Uncharacterized protein n=1 Tax=Mikania micrantha TaxID=192012 RepID=A0A5N6M4A7_9ASTR|nr:hypothetical protein E3N88_36664 [Mikania micrantha]